MSNINNISANTPLQGSDRVSSRTRQDAPAPVPPASTTTSGADEVEFSPAARRLSALRGNEGTIRPELIEQTREQITSGAYLNEQKLDAAADALIDRLEQGL